MSVEMTPPHGADAEDAALVLSLPFEVETGQGTYVTVEESCVDRSGGRATSAMPASKLVAAPGVAYYDVDASDKNNGDADGLTCCVFPSRLAAVASLAISTVIKVVILIIYATMSSDKKTDQILTMVEVGNGALIAVYLSGIYAFWMRKLIFMKAVLGFQLFDVVFNIVASAMHLITLTKKMERAKKADENAVYSGAFSVVMAMMICFTLVLILSLYCLVRHYINFTRSFVTH